MLVWFGLVIVWVALRLTAVTDPVIDTVSILPLVTNVDIPPV